MKSITAKLLRFFWSWGFLKFVLWSVTLFILVYVEEDWRGARSWAATKAEWEAKGETFELERFTPAPIREDENLAAIPLFKQEPAVKGDAYLQPLVLRKAMRTGADSPGGYDFPHNGNWQRGEPADLAQIRRVIAVDYGLVFKGATVPHETLDQFEALYPFLGDLRAAVTTRSFCRLDMDYRSMPPAGRGLGLLTDQITVSKILTLDAILALNEQRPDQALQDIRVNYVLLSGAARNPTLIGGLVAIGMNAICTAAIFNGLAEHAWSDAQLADLEQILAPINFLALYQLDMRATAADAVENLEYFKKASSLKDRRGLFVDAADRNDAILVRILPRWPDGWWDHNKSKMATFTLDEVSTVDPRARLVFPKIDSALSQRIARATAEWDADAPWNIWFAVSADPLVDQTRKFAYAQAWVDQAQIACGLERYRLAKGAYPELLDALAPADLEVVPHDVMNGQSYHYRLRPDGTFVLYSVGWNQVDDGGAVVLKKDAPKEIDYQQGDWAWPSPN